MNFGPINKIENWLIKGNDLKIIPYLKTLDVSDLLDVVNSSLLWSTSSYKKKLEEMMIKEQLFAEKRFANKKYPILLACIKNTDCLPLLIKGGANVNAQDEIKRTPLSILTGRNNIKGMKIVLGAGANPNLKNHEGNMPLHQICKLFKENKTPEGVELLLKHGAKIDGKNSNKFTPLMLLCRHYPDECQRLAMQMIKWGADVHAQNKYKESALDIMGEFDEDVALEMKACSEEKEIIHQIAQKPALKKSIKNIL